MSFDQQKESLLRFGVVYVLKYLGSVEILCSMKQLQFNQRRKLTRECIKEISARSRDAQSFGRSKSEENSAKTDFSEFVSNNMVSNDVDLFLSGVEVLFTVSVDMLKVARKDTNQIFLTHKMELVSFASGGEDITSGCIAYVAKDEFNRRLCFVLESQSGLESMIISTIGQAFELKYNDSLKEGSAAQLSYESKNRNSTSFNVNAAKENTKNNSDNDEVISHHISERQSNLHSTAPKDSQFSLNSANPSINKRDHCSSAHDRISSRNSNNVNTNSQGHVKKLSNAADNLDTELWFHGKISRSKAEDLLRHDGDFLVRECSHLPGQYVLSGRYANKARHLLLVDPEGVVRTRGCKFESISHLIYHHQQKRISIVSPDSELMLLNPVIRTRNL